MNAPDVALEVADLDRLLADGTADLLAEFAVCLLGAELCEQLILSGEVGMLRKSSVRHPAAALADIHPARRSGGAFFDAASRACGPAAGLFEALGLL